MVDALTASDTPEQIAKKLSEHLKAGADHVDVDVLTRVTGLQPVEQWRTLAPVLL